MLLTFAVVNRIICMATVSKGYKTQIQNERKIIMIKRIDLIQWNCDKCYSDMEVTRVGRNRYLVHCPNCGTEWYVDEDGELLD